MSRQRFIWPSMWSDKSFGELKPDEQVLFIGLFSLADDEGRVSGDPSYLRAQIFTYKDHTPKKVQVIRDAVVEKMANVHLYRTNPGDEEAIQLLKWSEYQKPKYPKASKIPPCFPEASGNLPPSLPEASPIGFKQGWVGLDRDGQGRGDEQPSPASFKIPDNPEVEQLANAIRNRGEDTAAMLAVFAAKLPPAAFATAREDLREHYGSVTNDGAYVRTILERYVSDGQYQSAA